MSPQNFLPEDGDSTSCRAIDLLAGNAATSTRFHQQSVVVGGVVVRVNRICRASEVVSHSHDPGNVVNNEIIVVASKISLCRGPLVLIHIVST